MNRREGVQWGRITLLSTGVVVQVILEVTAGRFLPAPNVTALVLTYLMIDFGAAWAYSGAFWAGAALDLILHQPPGCSSLGLLCGLLAGRTLLQAIPGENRTTLVLTASLVGLVSDALFFAAASRPFLSSLDARILVVVPRTVLTFLTGFVSTSLVSLAGMLRRERTA